MNRINLLIADDSTVARQCISSLINLSTEIKVFGQAENGEEVLDKFKEPITNKEIDVILLDVRMPKMGGLELIPLLRELNPEQKILLYSLYTDSYIIQESLRVKANGFVCKTSGYEELVKAIKTVSREKQYISKCVSDYLFEFTNKALQEEIPKKLFEEKVQITEGDTVSFEEIGLSEREKEILSLICNEFTTKEIAEKMFLSHRTVEGYRGKLFEKLDVKNVAGLVAQALLQNLVSIADGENGEK